MTRHIPLLALLLTACGPHASGRFFAPASPGTLGLPESAVYCFTAYGLRVYAAPTDGGRFSGETDYVMNECPARPGFEDAVREAAQEVPLTVDEVATWRLGIDPPGTTYWTNEEPTRRWVTDGYTIRTIRPRAIEAVRGAFELQREGHALGGR